jgi:hypothetical protein
MWAGRAAETLIGQATTLSLVASAAAHWAIWFYERHGFRPAGPEEKERLLTTYWTIPARHLGRPVARGP